MCKMVGWVWSSVWMWSRVRQGMVVGYWVGGNRYWVGVGNSIGMANKVGVGNRMGNVVGSCIMVDNCWMRMKQVVGTLVVLLSPEHLRRWTNLTSRLARRGRTSSFLSIDGFGRQRSSVAHPVAVPVFPQFPLLLKIKFNVKLTLNKDCSHQWATETVL